MVFRPFTRCQLSDPSSDYQPPLDKGFYYKFNCNAEIKLVKLTLEDNGFINQPYFNKQMSQTYKMMNDGQQVIRKQGDDWVIMWSTKHIKPSVYTHLKKYQRVS